MYGQKTVRLWFVRAGALLGDLLTRHSSWIMTLAYFLGGEVLTSGLHAAWLTCGIRSPVKCMMIYPTVSLPNEMRSNWVVCDILSG